MEEYEKWFIEKFGFPPMPIHSRVLDFCWHGYQSGAAGRDQLRQQLAEAERDRQLCYGCNSRLDQANDELYARQGKPTYEQLEKELHRERLRLSACGVVALSNTPESAAKAREMLPEYRSASCDDVARAVDREMKLRQQVTLLRDAVMPLILHRQSTNDSEYRAAERAMAATDPNP